MIFSYLLNMQSHPSWVCGLKHGVVYPAVAYLCRAAGWDDAASAAEG